MRKVQLKVGDILAKEFVIDRFEKCPSQGTKGVCKNCKGFVIDVYGYRWNDSGCPYNDQTENGLCADIIYVPKKSRRKK